MKPYLPANPLDSDFQITAIETVQPVEWMPQLLFVRIHTNKGVYGCGETFYGPTAVQALIHDWMADRLLGADPLAIESHWRFFYERFANFGVRGAEMRAISAIDLALWDILGKVSGLPIHRLLGGPVRNKIPVYNSCGNPHYGMSRGKMTWPGYGSYGEPGELQDSYNFFHNTRELIAELIQDGYNALKVWPLDKLAHQYGGMRIPRNELVQVLEPLVVIREEFGDSFDFMVDGHGFFMLPAALDIAEELRDLRPLWIEDVLKMDNVHALADFRKYAGVPVSVSEMLLTRGDFLQALNLHAADYVQIDPTWAGGISESMRIAHLAQTFNVPVTTHDCTGPLTLYAGLQINAAVPAACFQETVRAQIRTVYKEFVDEIPVVRNGHLPVPTRPGLGVDLNPDLFRKGPHYRISKLENR